MKREKMKAVIEGLLFVSGAEGLNLKQIASVLGVNKQAVRQVLAALQEDYQSEERGIDLLVAQDHYQLTTKAEHASFYQKLYKSPHHGTLSQAALETLAIIAYKQPITRVEIEDIRGVNTDTPLQTLVHKQLIKEVGRDEGIGRAILYGTTKRFLNVFALTSLAELPPLPDNIDQDALTEEAHLLFKNFPPAEEE